MATGGLFIQEQGETMKPYGHTYTTPGCVCSLCRSRGYRKNNAYGTSQHVSKHRIRQQAKRVIREVLDEAE